jgi:hypothetical protein
MTTIEQHYNTIIAAQVDLGRRWLDRVRPDWFNEVDLDQLDLRKCDACVLGQIVCMERDLYLQDPNLPQTFEGEYGVAADVGNIQGFDNLLTEELDPQDVEMIKAIDHLGDLLISSDDACNMGFHTGGGYDPSLDEWTALTDEWRRVIVAKREKQDATQQG